MALPSGNQHRVQFDLNSVEDPEFTKLLDPGGEDRVCVVSVVGKSSLRGGNCKASFIDESMMLNIFQKNLFPDIELEPDVLCHLEGFYDVDARVIFLHLTGVFDSNYLIKACSAFEQDIHKKSFLEVWSDFQTKQAKALLLLFQISHIVTIVHPTATFDVSCIQLFRTLDSMRQKAVPILSDLLSSTSVSSEWVSAGRPCSPRVLFVFQSCPLTSKMEDLLGDNAACARSKNPPPIKKLEHSLEDQIYHILRKSRVITNISGNSLFAVPANQEFVYVVLSENRILDPVDFYLSQMIEHSQMTKETGDSNTSSNGNMKRYTLTRRGSSHGTLALSNSIYDPYSPDGGGGEHSFRSFLWQHIDLALGKGFDDNVGRHPVPAYFELPKAKVWFQIFKKLKTWFLKEPADNRSRSVMNSLKNMLDVDGRFSEGRCAKVLPMASATYQDNLPSHYTEDYHNRKMLQALQVFALQARGPAYQHYAEQLQEDCDRFWRKGHQMCEVLSITDNHCINPVHRTSEDTDASEKHLPLMPHYSQVKYVSACDCGRRQAARDDPFDIKTANCSFYAGLHKDCCGTLTRITFPLFQRSSSDSHPAATEDKPPDGSSPSPPLPLSVIQGSGTIVSQTLESIQGDEEEDDDVEQQEESQSLSYSSEPESLSESAAFLKRVLLPAKELESTQKDENGKGAVKLDEQDGESKIDGNSLCPLHNKSSSTCKCNDKYKVRHLRFPQISTSEYLLGMYHNGCPKGLLPIFSSWSLVCLGPSSLYSHNIGIQDQPGFISGTNFLLPWDVTVKVEQKERWPSVWEGKRLTGIKGKKGGPPGGKDNSQFTVKIFIGVEYECPRGHRFMCSSPDRILRPSSSGLVKENANKVTGNDMPLYFPCPCRPSKPNMAQLMRIHVVTPKAPVHVTLNPKAVRTPIVFTPANPEPIKLSQSAYWVLRLPFVYSSHFGLLPIPKDPQSVSFAYLSKGTYGITQMTQEKLQM